MLEYERIAGTPHTGYNSLKIRDQTNFRIVQGHAYTQPTSVLANTAVLWSSNSASVLRRAGASKIDEGSV
jgi:hypothetical protein